MLFDTRGLELEFAGERKVFESCVRRLVAVLAVGLGLVSIKRKAGQFVLTRNDVLKVPAFVSLGERATVVNSVAEDIF